MDFVGNYRMFHLIRAGSVFEIWTVRPMSETTPYAMKWLPPGEHHTRHNVAELRYEYTVGKTLDHERVVKTYEFNSTSNGTYVLLELFKVPNLKQQIVTNQKAMQPNMEQILVQAAQGIHHLHERGWIHRDIKPDNFLMSDDFEVKIIDFNLAMKIPSGLSKFFGGKKQVAGTHSYMSPEQIRGQLLDIRTDVYSYGCMVHELFSGKAPFTANSPNELLTKHLRNRPPSLTITDKNITPEFANLVLRLISKDAKNRPSTMTDVIYEIKSTKMFYNPPQPEPKIES